MRRWIGGHAHVAKVALVAVMALLGASCQWVNGLRADHSIELAHRLLRLAIGALRRWVALEPENPEALYAIATFYWKEAMEDSHLTAEEEHVYLVPALTEVEQALRVDGDYVDALRYKDTLLRMRAQLTVDAGAATQMVADADLARDRAAALQ